MVSSSRPLILPLKFIVDESTGLSALRYLQACGYDVVSVREILPRADDFSILEYAEREERVVITNDKDFGELVFRARLPHKGVLLLRLIDESANNRVRVLSTVLEFHKEQLRLNFCVATETDFRVHYPPFFT